MPIGFFDSGVGGLSILRYTITLLPSYDYIYIADSANCTWGERDNNFILNRSRQLTRFLAECGARLIVVACNSASTNVIDQLRVDFPELSFVGVEPGVKPASEITKNGRIAVLATRATSRGNKYIRTKEKHTQGKSVITVAAPELVNWVEHDREINFCRKAKLSEILDPAISFGADTLVLGCTHFPFLIEQIKACLPDEITVIDTGDAVARQVERLCKSLEIEHGSGKLRVFTSGDVGVASKLVAKLMCISHMECETIEK